MLTVWVALVDATKENGCMQMLKKGHQSGKTASVMMPLLLLLPLLLLHFSCVLPLLFSLHSMRSRKPPNNSVSRLPSTS